MAQKENKKNTKTKVHMKHHRKLKTEQLKSRQNISSAPEGQEYPDRPR